MLASKLKLKPLKNVIVPLDSVESIPTEWKVVLLNTAEKDNVFFTDLLKAADRELWRWRNIDGRQLTFPNHNRPARRSIYALHPRMVSCSRQILAKFPRKGSTWKSLG